MRGCSGSARVAWRLRALSVVLALATPVAIVPACGARTGLRVGLPDAGPADATAEEAPPPQASFCEQATYRAGYSSLSIYILLDRSGSMLDDSKWDQATAAISAFVGDPVTDGLGVGLGYFPLSGNCSPKEYALPAVPIAPLPGNADNIESSLLAHTPHQGETPTRLALRAAIEYARGRAIANPHEEVAIILVTDGAPNACDSTVDNVAAVAADGADNPPQVLTFVIGQESASTSALDQIAAAGGTGKPIIVGKSPDSAQKLVDALEGLRQTLNTCRYAVPDVGGASVLPSDVTATYEQASGGPSTSLVRVADESACGDSGFYLDDPSAPTRVVLCPGVCQLLHNDSGSRVTVVAGCGEHSEAGVPDGGLDGGCNSIVTFSCTPKCGSGDLSAAICKGSNWTCPAGMTRTDTCGTCPVVPHGCCKNDGTLGIASCVNGAWVCPPGGIIFGDPGCRPPDVCTELLPCGPGQYCKSPDFWCGTGILPGTCKAIPSSCPGGGAQVCGCGDKTYASECAAATAGVDLSISGKCQTPNGTFACGPYFCKKQSEACMHSINFMKAHAQDSYKCVDGAGCGTPHPPCVCLKGHKCTKTCSQSGSATTITCTML